MTSRICTAILLLTTACQLDPKNIGDPTGDDSSGTSAAAETDGATSEPASTSMGSPSEPISTSDSVGTSETDSASQGTGPSETTTATDGAVTDTDTGGDDTGPMFPADCFEVDPEVDATYTLTVAGWPEEPETTGKLEVPCSVDAVTADADTVTTTLSCDIAGQQQAATLAIAASPVGPVAWSVGDPVTLAAEIWDEMELSNGRSVQLRGADDALLLSASEAYIDEGFTSSFAPLQVELVIACVNPNSEFATTPLRVDITPVDAPVVSIFSGHRDVVPIDADQTFAVDVEKAISDGFHTPSNTKALLRRVKLGG